MPNNTPGSTGSPEADSLSVQPDEPAAGLRVGPVLTGPTGTGAAAERVLAIYEAFHQMKRPMSLTELARHTGIPKSSCHAIVTTLTSRGYLYALSRPRALYPTRRLFDLTREIHEKDPLVERVMPMLERLRDASRETVILGKQQGEAVIYLQVLEGLHPIRYSARPGEFKPLHSSAIGKALLGSLREPEMLATVSALPRPRITDQTLTDPQPLAHDLGEGRRRGYYVTRGENVPDVWAVATTLSLEGQTLGVAVAGPRHRMQQQLIECAQQLLATCALISRPRMTG